MMEFDPVKSGHRGQNGTLVKTAPASRCTNRIRRFHDEQWLVSVQHIDRPQFPFKMGRQLLALQLHGLALLCRTHRLAGGQAAQ